MIRKWATVIAFGLGAWFGYRYSLQLIEYYEWGTQDYWSEMGVQIIQVVAPIAIGAVAAVVVYFLLNLFARAD